MPDDAKPDRLEQHTGIRSVRAVERAFDVLDVLEASGRTMRLSEVARTAAMHKATTQRLLKVLERRGWVERCAGRTRSAWQACRWAHAFRMGNSLSRAAMPVLAELAEATGETTTLFVRIRHDGFYVAWSERTVGQAWVCAPVVRPEAQTLAVVCV